MRTALNVFERLSGFEGLILLLTMIGKIIGAAHLRVWLIHVFTVLNRYSIRIIIGH